MHGRRPLSSQPSRALLAATGPAQAAESWLIVDAKFLARYGLGFVKPWPFRPGPWIKRGYQKRSTTNAELAQICGINPAALDATVTTFNSHARTGEDPEFQRGASSYNRYQGDPDIGPNPTLGPSKPCPIMP